MKLQQKLSLLSYFVVLLGGILSFLIFDRIRVSRLATFEEIQVKRINIIEEDGSKRIVISNQEKCPLPIVDGNEYPEVYNLQGLFSIGTMEILQAPEIEQKTQILILASPHLSQYKDHFEEEAFEPLLKVLKAWRPDAIGIEVQPAFSIAMQASNPAQYEMVNAQFSANILECGQEALQYLGISYDEATAKIDSLSAIVSDYAEMDAEIQKAYILYHLASYHYYTALLQWIYLSEEEKVQVDLPKSFSQHFQNSERSINETRVIALRLTQELQLQQIYQIDDHTDKDLFLKIAPQLSKDLQNSEEMKKTMQADLFKTVAEETRQGLEKKNILPLYLKLNSKSYQEADFDLQWNLFFRTQFTSLSDRKRVAVWDIRNLNIASNIRRVTALHPGKKILIVIGSSHKIFLDNYLAQLLDVELVHLNEIIP